jgi:hypothetical protein
LVSATTEEPDVSNDRHRQEKASDKKTVDAGHACGMVCSGGSAGAAKTEVFEDIEPTPKWTDWPVPLLCPAIGVKEQ